MSLKVAFLTLATSNPARLPIDRISHLAYDAAITSTRRETMTVDEAVRLFKAGASRSVSRETTTRIDERLGHVLKAFTFDQMAEYVQRTSGGR